MLPYNLLIIVNEYLSNTKIIILRSHKVNWYKILVCILYWDVHTGSTTVNIHNLTVLRCEWSLKFVDPKFLNSPNSYLTDGSIKLSHLLRDL